MKASHFRREQLVLSDMVFPFVRLPIWGEQWAL